MRKKTSGLRFRLFLISLGLSGVTLIVGGFGFMNLRRVVQRYDHLATVNMPRSVIANDMLSTMRRFRIGLRTVALPGVSSEEAKGAINKAEGAISVFDKDLEEYLKSEYSPGLQFGPSERELYEAVSNTWLEYKKIANYSLKLFKSGNPNDFKTLTNILFNQDPELAKNCATAIEKLITYQSEQAKIWVETAHKDADQSNKIVVGIILSGIIFSLISGLIFATRTTAYLGHLSATLQTRAKEVSEIAQTVKNESENVLSNTSSQSEFLQRTSASVEETSAMVGKNAANAKESLEIAARNVEIVETSKNAVLEMVRSMEDISSSNEDILTQVSTSNEEVSNIVKIIADIGQKANVINDIVFQTKLLSFNASVEAARAGEHGKGFAVVAEEVGNLAQMSGAAAKEITEMLEHGTKKVEETVENTKSRIDSIMNAAKSKVSAGMKTAKNCASILDQVVTNSGEVNLRLNDISAASDEQAHGIRDINKSMIELETVSQSNHRASLETSSSAERLREQVTALNDLIFEFNQTIFGNKDSNMNDKPQPPQKTENLIKKVA